MLQLAHKTNGFCEEKRGEPLFYRDEPRIQVQHTVTEELTNVDLVRAQILIAQGCALNDDQIGFHSQAQLHTHGFAMQCRVTTEDPKVGRVEVRENTVVKAGELLVTIQ